MLRLIIRGKGSSNIGQELGTFAASGSYVSLSMRVLNYVPIEIISVSASAFQIILPSNSDFAFVCLKYISKAEEQEKATATAQKKDQ